MNMIDLDELMRLHAAATPGPWEVKSGEFEGDEGYGTVTAPYVEADGKMICVPFDRDPVYENDEAEFEARVAIELVDLNGVTATDIDLMKFARLSVEHGMIQEGKGPGRREK